MGSVIKRLKSGSPIYTVEETGDGGFVLIPNPEYADEFSQLVRNLMSVPSSEFVILPTRNGKRRYSLAVVLPL